MPDSTLSTVAREKHLPLYIKDRTNYPKVARFLNFDPTDINRIVGQSQASKKILQSRVPMAIRVKFEEIANICEIVAQQFDGDTKKTKQWFLTKNYFLGYLSPRDMIRFNRYEALKKLVISTGQGHLP